MKRWKKRPSMTLWLVLALLVGCLTGCSGRSPTQGPPPFIGIWLAKVSIFDQTYRFNADGTDLV